MIQDAQSAFHKAIADMDVSKDGLPSQFDAAFSAYGKGNENVPNRFQRLFWKLRHEITGEKVVWEKPTGSGAAFVTWGARDCGSNSDTTILGIGHAAATSSNSWGGGKNFMCLPSEKPVISQNLNPPATKTSAIETAFLRSIEDPENEITAIPCANCLAVGKIDAEVFQAMQECPKGWRLEYSGYVMAESVSSVARDFICVKKEAEKDVDATPSKTAPKLNHLFMNCGKCEVERVVPCVVCTK